LYLCKNTFDLYEISCHLPSVDRLSPTQQSIDVGDIAVLYSAMHGTRIVLSLELKL